MQYYINNIPVSKSDYESHKQAKKKRKKTIILILLGVFIVGFSFYFGIIAFMKNTDAYMKAEEVIRNNREVIEITSGIKKVDLNSGSVKIVNEQGEAEFYIEVEGTKKDTDVYIHLKKTNKDWEADYIEVN